MQRMYEYERMCNILMRRSYICLRSILLIMLLILYRHVLVSILVWTNHVRIAIGQRDSLRYTWYSLFILPHTYRSHSHNKHTNTTKKRTKKTTRDLQHSSSSSSSSSSSAVSLLPVLHRSPHPEKKALVCCAQRP